MQNVGQKVISKISQISLLSVVLTLAVICQSQATIASSYLSPCRGRPIPSEKTRAIRNLRLECTSGVSVFGRGPQILGEKALEKWKEQHEYSLNAVDPEERFEIRKEMQIERQKEAPIVRSRGVVSYQTREVWDWTEWVYGQHPSCGYSKKQVYDKILDKMVEVEIMNSCYHDEYRHEDHFCSDENVSYEAEFVRPSFQEWNPNHPDYTDLLPNKYDLMYGEFENIQVYSNDYQSASLSPTVYVKPAWNSYVSHVQFPNGYSSVPCEVDTPRSVYVKIYTEKRLTNRSTPNSFGLPKDEKGETIESLQWFTMPNEEGKIVRSRPDSIVLRDHSADIVEMFSKETRVEGQAAESSDEEASEEEKSSDSDQKKWKKFYKNTVIRVRLVQRGYNLWIPRTITTGSNEMARDEFNNYIIPLNSKNPIFSRSSGYFSAFFNWFKVSLQPNQDYTLYVSMYQKDMPFYAQECNKESYFYLACKAIYWDSHFSPEIAIDFKTEDKLDYKAIINRILEII